MFAVYVLGIFIIRHMLKRPRLPSPPLPQEDSLLLPISIDTSTRLPHLKRRRTLGPVIDSKEREISTSSFLSEEDIDDGEENIFEDIVKKELPSTMINEYEHINGFLHRLHTESQRRAQQAADNMDRPNNHDAEGPKKGSNYEFPSKLSIRNTDLPHFQPDPQDTRSGGHHNQQLEDSSQQSLDEERTWADSNYVNHNRYVVTRVLPLFHLVILFCCRMLGSLVLSRRLHLRSSEDEG